MTSSIKLIKSTHEDEPRDSHGRWTAGGAEADQQAPEEDVHSPESELAYVKLRLKTELKEAKAHLSEVVRDLKTQHKDDTKEYLSSHKEELETLQSQLDEQLTDAAAVLKEELSSPDDFPDAQAGYDAAVTAAKQEFEEQKQEQEAQHRAAMFDTQETFDSLLAEAEDEYLVSVEDAQLSHDTSMVEMGKLPPEALKAQKKAVAQRRLKTKLQRLKEAHDRHVAAATGDYEAIHGKYEVEKARLLQDLAKVRAGASDIIKALTHRKAYSYVNKHGKIVHVKEHGVASAPEVAEKKKRKAKLPPDQWAATLKASLEDWDQALGHGESYHLEDIKTEDQVQDWLKTNAVRLRKNGRYLLDITGKVLPPTHVKRKRTPVFRQAYAANTTALRQYAAKQAGVPVDECDFLKHREILEAEISRAGFTPMPNAMVLELEAYKALNLPDGAKTDAEGAAVMRYCSKSVQGWYAKNKAKALRLGVPLMDGCGNALLLPPATLPPAPWTVNNARRKMLQGAEALGFNAGYATDLIVSPWRQEGGLDTGQATLKALEGLSLVLNASPAVRQGIRIKVAGIASPSTAAVYYSSIQQIDIDPGKGRHSVYHEFGHYLDHFLGDAGTDGGFASETPPGENPQRQAVHAFIAAAKATHSYAIWDTEDREHQKDYWHQPTEMVARFFDQWCEVRLAEKGAKPSDYFSCPYYTRSKGRFRTEDFNALRPAFEKAFGSSLLKAASLFFDLAKSRTSGAKGKAPKLGKYGALVSSDPSFYPGKGGLRYLAASETGKVAGIVARYAKNGIAVTFLPPTQNLNHLDEPTPVSVRPVEAQIADDVVAGMDALHSQVQGKPADLARLRGLPEIGVDPITRPMTYLLSMGWGKRDAAGKNVLTAQESKALLQEFDPTVRAVVGSVGKRLGLKRLQRMELQSDAALFLLESAQAYDVQKRGQPGPGRNFLALMQGSLTRRLAGDLTDERRASQNFQSYTEEPNRDAGEDLRVAAREARIETAEQRMRRQELGAAVSHSLQNVLSPVEYATVISRLNILNHQTHGVSDEALSTGLKVGGLKPWYTVKDDVLNRLQHLTMGNADRAKLHDLLVKVPPGNYKAIFERAMDKLRSPDGLSAQERQQLGELADLQRLYLEGVRHEVFDTEAIGRLQVAPEPTVGFGTTQAQKREARAKQAMADLPQTQQADAFWEAHPALAQDLRITPDKAAPYYRLADHLKRQSTDALRARMHRPPPAGITQKDYVRLVTWALQGSMHKALCVIPPYASAWAGLTEECTVWAVNGW